MRHYIMEAEMVRNLLHHPGADSPVRFIRSPIFWEAQVRAGHFKATQLFQKVIHFASFNGHARRGFASKLRDAHGIETSNIVNIHKHL